MCQGFYIDYFYSQIGICSPLPVGYSKFTSEALTHCLWQKQPDLWVKITSPLTFAVLAFDRTSLNHTWGQLQPAHRTARVKPSQTTTDMSRLMTAWTSLCSLGRKTPKPIHNLGRKGKKREKNSRKKCSPSSDSFLNPVNRLLRLTVLFLKGLKVPLSHKAILFFLIVRNYSL